MPLDHRYQPRLVVSEESDQLLRRKAPRQREEAAQIGHQYRRGRAEPDPLIGLVWKSDGVDRRDLELLLGWVRAGAGGAIARPDVLIHMALQLLSNTG
jgi:hypothetical protein